jgi:hypothetical protein
MMSGFGVVRRRGDKEAMSMRELIVSADVTLDGFMAGDEKLDQVLCAGSMP